ncbi:hypothetical protein B5807_07026 [Epicoccum nigrum]|uniref:FAD-binding domain-containing protein n=1 Tax=Epicoccum nigrum TaxID=105696 RepID=A0A1Y2M0G2_EPING|nr:hypothetical protein B5807_07026 [Epicoccum nigrum]
MSHSDMRRPDDGDTRNPETGFSEGSSISCTIFEVKASINYRSQGGSLDLRSSTGLAAVKAAGLWEQFLEHARYGGESLLLTDKHLTTWVRRSPGTKDQHSKLQEAPEIDRRVLRKILIKSVPPECVKWNCKLASVQETISSGLELSFANGEQISGFDLIVGADGAWSKTKTLLSSDLPSCSGLSGWTMQISNAKEVAPEAYKFVNRGSVFSYCEGKSVTVQQLDDGSLNVSHYGIRPADFIDHCEFDTEDLDATKNYILEQIHDWAPQFRNFVVSANESLFKRSLCEMPVGWTWPHREGVTLLGDAAHLMTPFAGICVNTAFYDALELAKQIKEFNASEDPASLDTYVAHYEKAMLENARRAQEYTEGSKIDMLFTPGAPRTTIESYILRHAKQDTPLGRTRFCLSSCM